MSLIYLHLKWLLIRTLQPFIHLSPIYHLCLCPFISSSCFSSHHQTRIPVISGRSYLEFSLSLHGSSSMPKECQRCTHRVLPVLSMNRSIPGLELPLVLLYIWDPSKALFLREYASLSISSFGLWVACLSL